MRKLVFLTLLFTGCVCLDPAHHRKTPPTVQTEKVIASLKQIKNDLDSAGDENENVSQKLDKALTLANKLDLLLEQLEVLFSDGKTTVKPL